MKGNGLVAFHMFGLLIVFNRLVAYLALRNIPITVGLMQNHHVFPDACITFEEIFSFEKSTNWSM
jgi:hypothetical protein